MSLPASVFDDAPAPTLHPEVPGEVRCRNVLAGGRVCGKKLAEFAAGAWRIRCPRCKAVNESTVQ